MNNPNNSGSSASIEGESLVRVPGGREADEYRLDGDYHGTLARTGSQMERQACPRDRHRCWNRRECVQRDFHSLVAVSHV